MNFIKWLIGTYLYSDDLLYSHLALYIYNDIYDNNLKINSYNQLKMRIPQTYMNKTTHLLINNAYNEYLNIYS
jgi:hypothetical protein